MNQFKLIVATAVVLAALTAADRLIAQAPTTAPSETAVTTPLTTSRSLMISTEADALLVEVKAAYAALTSLQVSGTVTLEFDGAGQKQSNRADFDGAFLAPNKFRHEIKDDLLVVSTGEKTFLYQPMSKEYMSEETSKERPEWTKLSKTLSEILNQQDPSLLLATTADARRTLTDGAADVARADDVIIEQIAYPVLTYLKGGAHVRAVIDPKTKLLRQVSVDQKAKLIADGTPQVNKALIVVDYLKTAFDAPNSEQFAWAPPFDAKLASANEESGAGGAIMALVGKAAPDFTLNDLDGKAVKLSDLKGSVVLLDYWATWCPPCVAGLPKVQKLSEEFAAKGLKFFAVNLQEDKPTIQRFLKQRSLNVSVLMDSDAAVAKKFAVEAIPVKVLIGKDGMIRQVFVGETEDSETKLKTAIEAALR